MKRRSYSHGEYNNNNINGDDDDDAHVRVFACACVLCFVASCSVLTVVAHGSRPVDVTLTVVPAATRCTRPPVKTRVRQTRICETNIRIAGSDFAIPHDSIVIYVLWHMIPQLFMLSFSSSCNKLMHG